MAFTTYRKRVLIFGSVSTASVVLLTAILVLLNYLSFRHYERIDLTQNKIYSLSDQTRAIVSEIEEPIDIFVFFPRTSRLFSYISYTLEEMKKMNPQINVEYIDVDRDLLRVQEFAKKYKLSSEDYIVVTSGDNFRVLVLDDLAEFEFQGSFYEQQEPILKGFKGEQAIVSAMLSVIQDEQETVYFTVGHGEKDIDDEAQETGYEAARDALRHNNYRVKRMTLADQTTVPADCRLLIIAGPQAPFTEHEIDLIQAYLDTGKPLMALLDPGTQTGIEHLIERFGIKAGDDVVFDPSQCVPFASPAYLLADIVAHHPITQQLGNMMGMFFITRSVTRSSSEKETVKHAVLAQTTNNGWAEKNYEEEPVEKDPDVDIPGPVSVAMATEDTKQPFNRLVVFGDSDFLTNTQLVNLANSNLFLNSVTWLLHKKEPVSIPAKPFDRITISITSSQMRSISYIVVLFMPLTSLSIGITIWFLRRKF